MTNLLPVKLTTHKKGLKLESFISLNVSLCGYCRVQQADKLKICSQCYGAYMMNRYSNLKKALEFNYRVLSTRILTSKECKDIEKKINGKKDLSGLRFDSIGELINDIHVQNLENIAYEIDIDKVPVTIWTKRPLLLFKVLDKPLFNVIVSTEYINTFKTVYQVQDELWKVYGLTFDILHTFNVYDDIDKMNADMEWCLNHDIDTAVCHGKCKDCMICYPVRNQRRLPYAIFELSKKAQMQLSKVKS